jgi:regulator of protease activity HflC (stomatin/prohibitin superfamily)
MVKDIDMRMTITKIVKWTVFAVVILIIFFGSWYIVYPGERGVLVTLGSPGMNSMEEGFHFKVPLIQTVQIMNVKTQKYDADASAASSDLQVVSTKIAVNYHLIPESVPDLYQKTGLAYRENIIQPAVQEVVKAATAQFTAEELITKRALVKARIDEMLMPRLAEKKIILETTSITNFDFSEEFNKAIEAKVTAQQTALKAENDLTRIKVEKEQTITMAEAHAQAIKLNADAEAYALMVVREQLQMSNSLIQYKSIEKWNGILPIYMMGDSTPLVQIPSFTQNASN